MDFGKHIFDTEGAPPSRKHQAFSVSIEHLVISLSFGEFPDPCKRKNDAEEEQPKRARLEAPCASSMRKNEDEEEQPKRGRFEASHKRKHEDQ